MAGRGTGASNGGLSCARSRFWSCARPRALEFPSGDVIGDVVLGLGKSDAAGGDERRSPVRWGELALAVVRAAAWPSRVEGRLARRVVWSS